MKVNVSLDWESSKSKNCSKSIKNFFLGWPTVVQQMWLLNWHWMRFNDMAILKFLWYIRLINVQGSKKRKVTRPDRAYSRQYLCVTIADKSVPFLKTYLTIFIFDSFWTLFLCYSIFPSSNTLLPCSHVLEYALPHSFIAQ